jgi:cysteine-rich repeat protein
VRAASARIVGFSALFILVLFISPSADFAARRAEQASERLQYLRARAKATYLLQEESSATGKAGQGKGPNKGGPGQGRAFSPEIQATAGIFGTQSETSIAVFGNNVVIGFNQFDPGAPAKRSGVTFSTNGGLSFTDTGGLPTGGASQILLGDPSVTACGDGKFYYSSIYFPNATDSALAVNVGTVTGANISWTNPLLAISATADFLDKEWLTCDRLTNTLYMTYTRFVNGNVGDPTARRIEIIKSVNGGVTWTPPLILDSSSTESIEVCYVATGPSSEVYTMWERGIDDILAANTKLEFRRSFDFANSFNPKVTVRTMIPSFFPAMVGFNRESTLEIGTLAADHSTGPNRGNLYAVWVEREAGGGEKRDVFVSTSSNRGTIWSAPVRVNDDPAGNDQVMPWLSVNDLGTVEVVWYDYRNWKGMYTVDVYGARSSDGGATFSSNFRVTTVPSSWFAPLTITPNFGDYIGSASEGTGFYPTWGDARNNDIDVFSSHIPTATCGNGTPEAFEQCDDGNQVDGDSCSPACAITLCGNGFLEGAEQCDDGNLKNGDGCSQACRSEVCGDGIIQKNNREECDDTNTASGDGCSATCQIELDKMAWIADERSRLHLESVSTGFTMIIGDPGFHELGDLAFDAAGNLFGSTGFNPNLTIGYNGYLLSMAATGLPNRGAVIGNTGWLSMSAIDFHPLTDVLYGIAVDDLNVSRLVTLNPATGATTSTVGDLGLIAAGAMAFDAAGTLYVAGKVNSTDVGHALYTVGLAPFNKTLVGPIGFALSGMDFAPDGSLYGVVRRRVLTSEPEPPNNGGLILINKTSGAGTLLFATSIINQQGIRFAPPNAVDRDLDGIHDVADCAPLSAANSPPGRTANLAFGAASGGSFTWSPAADSLFSNSYRGSIVGPMAARLPGSAYDHVCFESADAQGNGTLVSSDPSTPPVGSAYYYLTDGEGCGEGALDTDATHPIPNPSPCPTPP